MTERESLLAGLALTPTIVAGMCESIADDLWDRRRGRGVWTLKEHLAHLADSQKILIQRAKLFVEQERPKIVPYNPTDDEVARFPVDLRVAELVSLFTKRREEYLSIVRDYAPAIWGREADHPEYERYGAMIQARHTYMHDLWHLYRMEELWLARDQFLTRME